MSNYDTHASAPKRSYRLGKRAEKQEETRRRIVEAAVDLHSTIGPAQTTVAQIAERAGVQRHTYYAHFPTEWDLVLACSGLALERDPLPDLKAIETIPPGKRRLRYGLEQFYAWFERNAQMAGCVLRDAERHQLTRDIIDLRMAPTFAGAAQLLGATLSERQRALVAVAMDFACWRALSQSSSPSEAAALMTDAIVRIHPGQ